MSSNRTTSRQSTSSSSRKTSLSSTSSISPDAPKFVVQLEKRDRNNGMVQMFYRPWAKRTFALQGQMLHYYLPNTDVLRGEIPLRNCRVEIASSVECNGKSFPFVITTDKKTSELRRSEKIYLSASCADQRQLCMVYFTLASKSSHWSLKKLRVLFCSLDGSGKTSIIHRLVNGTFSFKLPPTVQPTITSYNHPIGYPLDIIDISGTREQRRYWCEHATFADIIVFPIDATNDLTFQLCKYEIANLIEHTRSRHIPYLILANKIDLCEKNKVMSLLSKRLGLEQSYARGQVVDLQICSAKTGEEMEEVEFWIGAAAKEMLKMELMNRTSSKESQRSIEELISTSVSSELNTPTKLEPIPEEGVEERPMTGVDLTEQFAM